MLNKLKGKYDLRIFIIGLLSLLFSFWLMFSTFSYDNGSILISTKAWSDFGGHIPLIRSFSFGSNFPPEYPIFPGEPIRYHFLFYFLVGMLEKAGLRIDLALNLPSFLSFAFLIFVIYFFAKTIFKSKAVGILSVIFFLFNGSISFLEFFKIHPLSVNTINDIIKNNIFPSFGPYDGKIISAFWNLNIYTNQRHLALSLALSLFLISFLIFKINNDKKINWKLDIVIGLLLGASFYLHAAVLLMTYILLVGIFALFKRLRFSIFLILLFSTITFFPQYLYFQSTESSFKILVNPGYLIFNNLTLLNFLNYWFLNLGLHIFLMILGFIFAPKNAKKIFIAFFTLFIIGNLFQFSPEIAANHKFFNYFLLIGVMFSAYFLVYLWRKSLFVKPAIMVLIFFLTFSGIIDFFPIYNDLKIEIADYPKNQGIVWIMQNTPKDAVFLNNSYFNTPASLAGRKIFMGWPYFPWSQGYNTDKRGKLMEKIYQEKDKNIACSMLKTNSLDYIEINTRNLDIKNISNLYYEKFLPIYTNKEKSYFVFSTQENCSVNK